MKFVSRLSSQAEDVDIRLPRPVQHGLSQELSAGGS